MPGGPWPVAHGFTFHRANTGLSHPGNRNRHVHPRNGDIYVTVEHDPILGTYHQRNCPGATFPRLYATGITDTISALDDFASGTR